MPTNLRTDQLCTPSLSGDILNDADFVFDPHGSNRGEERVTSAAVSSKVEKVLTLKPTWQHKRVGNRPAPKRTARRKVHQSAKLRVSSKKTNKIESDQTIRNKQGVCHLSSFYKAHREGFQCQQAKQRQQQESRLANLNRLQKVQLRLKKNAEVEQQRQLKANLDRRAEFLGFKPKVVIPKPATPKQTAKVFVSLSKTKSPLQISTGVPVHRPKAKSIEATTQPETQRQVNIVKPCTKKKQGVNETLSTSSISIATADSIAQQLLTKYIGYY